MHHTAKESIAACNTYTSEMIYRSVICIQSHLGQYIAEEHNAIRILKPEHSRTSLCSTSRGPRREDGLREAEGDQVHRLECGSRDSDEHAQQHSCARACVYRPTHPQHAQTHTRTHTHTQSHTHTHTPGMRMSEGRFCAPMVDRSNVDPKISPCIS